MVQAANTEVLHRLLEPLGQCLTQEVAGRIVRMRATDEVQARFDELADRNTEGALTDEEHAEYEALISGATFIAVLQAKARALRAQGNDP